MNSNDSAARRACRSWNTRRVTLLLGLASAVIGCSVYDESLREGPPAGSGGADGGSNGSISGADAGGDAGTSFGGELIDAGAPGAGGDSDGLPTGGTSHGGGAAGGASGGMGGVAAPGGTGGVVASAGAAGTSTSGAGNGPSGSAGAGSELAVGKQTLASTQQPANASASGNDGQPATRWSATTADLPQWWRVDLGASHALTRVSVQFEFADRKYTYAVETSADGASYTTQANVVEGMGALQVVTLPSNVSARYVRITCTNTVPGIDPSTGASRPTWVSFWEVSVLGS